LVDAETSSYNTVFERLKERADPVRAAIAYAFYKEAKREWILDFKQTNQRNPNEQELKSFASAQTETVLKSHLTNAEAVLSTYAEDVVEKATPGIRERAIQGRFWTNVWPSVVANAIFLVALVILAAIAAYLGFGLPIQISPEMAAAV